MVKLQAEAAVPSMLFLLRVFVNGKEIGDHRAGGYVAFWLDVPADALRSNEMNELFVLADNRYNHTTAPLHTGAISGTMAD